MEFAGFTTSLVFVGLDFVFLKPGQRSLARKVDAGVKSSYPELMPRSFWFRWAAMFTFLSGLAYYALF